MYICIYIYVYIYIYVSSVGVMYMVMGIGSVEPTHGQTSFLRRVRFPPRLSRFIQRGCSGNRVQTQDSININNNHQL